MAPIDEQIAMALAEYHHALDAWNQGSATAPQSALLYIAIPALLLRCKELLCPAPTDRTQR
jgi:hypothetical protein